MEKPHIELLHCNRCGPRCKHVRVANHTQVGSEDCDGGYTVDWTEYHEMFECGACEGIVIRRRYYFSEWGHNEFEECFYPPRTARQLPRWKDDLPEDIVATLEEVYAALQANSHRLAMMGARTLVDMIIYDKVGDVGSFAEKLKALVAEGYLGKRHRDVLTAALDVGNAAAHRGYCPKPEHVQHVMEIVENLLHSTVIEPLAEELVAATPKRKKTPKNNAAPKNP